MKLSQVKLNYVNLWYLFIRPVPQLDREVLQLTHGMGAYADLGPWEVEVGVTTTTIITTTITTTYTTATSATSATGITVAIIAGTAN